MVRSGGFNNALRKAKIFNLSKGYLGRNKNCWVLAMRRVQRAMWHMNVARRLRKRDFRKIWISRIGAGTKEIGINYSRFTHNMVRTNIVINRKLLSQLAIFEPTTFKSITYLAMAKERGNQGLKGLLDPVPREPRVLQRVKVARKMLAKDEAASNIVLGSIPESDREELGIA